jgi:hypothetical protein
LNFGFGGQHVMPVMLFTWLIISITGLIYLKALHPRRSNRFIYLIGIMQIVLACLNLTTFIFPFTMHYIPIYATILILINILSFLLLYVINAKGKSFLRLTIICSSFIVFIYTPHKAIIDGHNYKVEFELKTKEEVKNSKLFLYLNYYKYGKEVLVLHRKSDSLFSSGEIEFSGSNITMSYAVLKDSLSFQHVLYNSKIEKNELELNKADTVFSITYYTSLNP